MLTKSFSCNEIWTKQNSQPDTCASQSPNYVQSPLAALKRHKSSDKLTKTKTENHKTVIYFGDSISSKKQHNQLQQQMKSQQMSTNCVNSNEPVDQSSDLKHAQRLCDEMVCKRQQSDRIKSKSNEVHAKCAIDDAVTIVNDVKVIKNESMNLVKHLKMVLEEKCHSKNEKIISNETKKIDNCNDSKDLTGVNGDIDAINTKADVGKKLPSFVESVVNGVINIKIDDSYDAATKLVRSIESHDIEDGNDMFLDVGGEVNNMYLDWSFVQDWRSR